MRRFLTAVWLLAKRRWALSLVALLCLALVPFAIKGALIFDKEVYQQELDDMRQLGTAGSEVDTREESDLTGIVNESDSAEYLRRVQEHLRHLADAFMGALKTRPSPKLVSATNAMPDVYFLAHWLGNIPTVLWLLVTGGLAVAIASEERCRATPGIAFYTAGLSSRTRRVRRYFGGILYATGCAYGSTDIPSSLH